MVACDERTNTQTQFTLPSPSQPTKPKAGQLTGVWPGCSVSFCEFQETPALHSVAFFCKFSLFKRRGLAPPLVLQNHKQARTAAWINHTDSNRNRSLVWVFFCLFVLGLERMLAILLSKNIMIWSSWGCVHVLGRDRTFSVCSTYVLQWIV